MESEGDRLGSEQGICVKLSTTACLRDVGKLKGSLEDSNRNLTCCSDPGIAVQPLATSPKHVSFNGPNGLVNGIDLDKYEAKPRDGAATEDVADGRVVSCAGQSATGDVKFALECKKALQELMLEAGQDAPSGRPEAALRERLQAGPRPDLVYVSYENEHQMPDIMRLIQKDLSEPYSIYTYRYFIHKWPQLCFLAMDGTKCVGAIVCKLDIHRKVIRRGYIAMLAVDEKYRKRKIGTNLVLKAIRAMTADNADEIVLETEITNNSALCLYENLGFVRDKRLFRYYLNGVDALRLKLWLR